MANAIIQLPIPYVGDFNKGRPIFNGKIYIGEPDLDPSVPANQKIVSGIQSDGTLVAMSQPIRTSSGGYPTYNGSPVRLSVAGAYSLKILNQKDEEEYYFGNVLQGAPVVFSDNPVLFAQTAERLQDLDAEVGQLYQTKGFTDAGDAGAAQYMAVPAGTGVNDGILFIDTAAGPQFQRLPIPIQHFDSVADAKLARWLGIGDFVSTRGYYSELSGGGSSYIVVAAGTGVDDGGSYMNLLNLNQIELDYNGAVNIYQFGAKADGVTNNDAPINAALDLAKVMAADEYLVVTVPPGDLPFIFTDLSPSARTTFKGTGGVLKLEDNTTISSTTNYYLIYNLAGDSVVYDSLIVDGNPATNQREFSTGVADLITCSGKNSSVLDCRLIDAPDSAVMFSNVFNGRCDRNIISGASDAGIYVNGAENSIPQNISVSSNSVRDCHTVGIALKRGLNTALVSNNYVFRCGNGLSHEDFGEGNGGHPTNMTIVGNNFSDIGYMWRTPPLPAETGMTLNRLTNSVVSNNNIQGNGGSGIDVAGGVNSIISGNLINGYTTSPNSTQDGIVIRSRVDSVTSQVTTTKNLTIIGNSVDNIADKALNLTDPLAVNVTMMMNNVKSLGNAGMYIATGVTNVVATYNILEALPADLDIRFVNGSNCILRGNIAINDGNGDYYKRNGPIIGFYTPQFIGQRALDTSTTPGTWYTSTGLTNSDWS